MGVHVTSSKAVATVTMNWPESRNALDLDRIQEVATAVSHAAATSRAIVLTGAGAFCSGANLSSVASSSRGSDQRRDDIEAVPQSLIKIIVNAEVPVFAAIDGPAIGLGFDLALACEERFIGPNGWCMQGWGRIGVIAGTGGTLMLSELNPCLLWRLLAEQPRISGQLAERWGIGEAVEEGTALAAATARANSVASLPIKAIHAYTKLSRESLKRQLDDHLKVCAAHQAELLADPGLPDRISRLRSRSAQAVPRA